MTVNPADSAIFGGLFGTPEMRALFSDASRLQAMLDVEVALARVEARLGLIPKNAAAAIARAAKLRNLDIAGIAEGTRLAGVPVTALAQQLGKAAGKAGAYVHFGATTQDIVDTALVLQFRMALDLIERDLQKLGDDLAAQARRHADTLMAGRTYMQQALPITFGYKCALWLAPLAVHRRRLAELKRRLFAVQFGGAVGTLASLGNKGRAVAQGLARELNLGIGPAPWHANREVMAEAASVLGLICGSLGKLAADMILLSQNEIGEAFEPAEPGRGGSSTMPQKRNPVASTYIIACMRGVHALVPLMLESLAGDHERSTGPWQSEALALPQIFTLTSGALNHARDVAKGVRVDAKHMRQNLDATRGLVMAEAATTGLALKLGRSLAKRRVAAASEQALKSGKHLADLLAEDRIVAEKFSALQIARLLDPARYLGDAKGVVARVTADWRRK